MKVRNLEERDKAALWHPYTQHGLNSPLPGVIRAQGAHLEFEDGSRALDAISSWWVNLHGHGHPVLVEALRAQASRLDHVLFAGFTHEAGVELAEVLVEALASRGLGKMRAFYSDNGSTAVEAALKMAYQYQLLRGESQRQRFLALKGSYHGDTVGCMSVGARGGFHEIFEALLFPVDFVEANDLDSLDEALQRRGDHYAAFIVEPLVQGAAGMKMHSSHFLSEAARRAQEKGILFIADEVFTGFYRTGTLFAFEQSQAKPDIVCLSKGLTGGMLPLAVTLCREQIFERFLGKSLKQAFLHGHSYTGNPIACAVALASWRLLHQPECLQSIEKISRLTQKYIKAIAARGGVANARSLGTIGAVSVVDREVGSGNYFSCFAPQISELIRGQGVVLRPLGNVIYAVPPYCTTEEEVGVIYQVIEEIIKKCQSKI